VKILLLDDDADLLDLTARRLRRKGADVVCASNLSLALSAFTNPGDSFDAVISDLFLGDENGLSFFEQLETLGYSGVFVLVSGDSDGDPRASAYQESKNRFHCLQKPYSLDVLLGLLGPVSERSA
jgi:DNA-binding NtrC family response regulator